MLPLVELQSLLAALASFFLGALNVLLRIPSPFFLWIKEWKFLTFAVANFNKKSQKVYYDIKYCHSCLLWALFCNSIITNTILSKFWFQILRTLVSERLKHQTLYVKLFLSPSPSSSECVHGKHTYLFCYKTKEELKTN